MAAYIKTQHNGTIHLVTASYAGAKLSDDKTFLSPDMGISTSNIYNFKGENASGPKFSDGFWNNEVVEKYLNDDCSDDDVDYEGYNDPCGDELNFSPKPMIFCETGPIDIECDGNYIETNRNMWEGLFSGLAGALSWNNWYESANYAIYGQMKNFVAGIDFDGGQWHPGASKRNDLPKWIYKSAFANDMESQVVDLAYLRSGDGNFAIGVLTNKSFNSRNFPSYATTCVDNNDWSFPEEHILINPADYNADDREGVKLRDLKADDYHINYFLPTDLSTPIHSSNGNNGPQIPLEINISATEQTYIILFKARRQGHNWEDITQMAETNTSQESKESYDLNESHDTTKSGNQIEVFANKDMNITVYPVPASHILILRIQNIEGQIDCCIEGMDGKSIRNFRVNNEKVEVDLNNIQRGTYLIKFFQNGIYIKTEKVIKL